MSISNGVIRGIVTAAAMIGALWFLVPELFPSIWPYLAAAGTLIVPFTIYRWWNARHNPGCGVRFPNQEPDAQTPADNAP